MGIEDLKANTEYHNYTPQSEQVQWFWKVLSEFSQEQRHGSCNSPQAPPVSLWRASRGSSGCGVHRSSPSTRPLVQIACLLHTLVSTSWTYPTIHQRACSGRSWCRPLVRGM